MAEITKLHRVVEHPAGPENGILHLVAFASKTEKGKLKVQVQGFGALGAFEKPKTYSDLAAALKDGWEEGA